MDNRIAAVCGVAVLLAGAAACGSSKGGVSPTGSSTSGPRTSQQGAGPLPGAAGRVAAVSGSTAQVQSQQDGQVAVSWTSTTKFTQEVAARAADVEVGDCVLVTPSRTAASSPDDSGATDDTQVTAGSVRITATGGTCTPQLRGPGGGSGGPSLNGSPPSGAPSGEPPGAPPGSTGRVRGSFGALGKVTAVSGSGFTVRWVRPAAGGSSSTRSSAVTVTTSSSTTYTRTAAASAADVKVGGCLDAQGTTDSTGAVTAATIALSKPVGGECGGGFVRSGTGGPGSDSGSGSNSTRQES